jgi:hypothetical protein
MRKLPRTTALKQTQERVVLFEVPKGGAREPDNRPPTILSSFVWSTDGDSLVGESAYVGG